MRHFHDYVFRIAARMFSVIGLDLRIDPDGYPGWFNKVASQQGFTAWSQSHFAFRLTALMYPRHQPDAVAELAFIIEAPDIAQFGQDGGR